MVKKKKEKEEEDFPQHVPDGDDEAVEDDGKNTKKRAAKGHEAKKAAPAAPSPKEHDVDFAIDLDEKEIEKQEKIAAFSSDAVARRPKSSFMERMKRKSKQDKVKTIPEEEDGKIPAQQVAGNGADGEDVEEQPVSSSATSSAGPRRPMPARRNVTRPGAYAVEGLDGTGTQSDLRDDDTIFIGDSGPSSAVVSAASQAFDAHLVGDGQSRDYYEDHDGVVDIIHDLEDRNDDRGAPVLDAVVSDDDVTCWRKRSTKIGICLVFIVVIVAVSVGVSVGLTVGPPPSPPPTESNETISPAPTFMPSTAPSFSPTSTEFTELIDFLSASSLDGGAAVQTASSPQYQAARWLFNNANYSEYANAQRIQRYAMAVLYYSTDGPNWLQATKWMTDAPECEWFNKGVTFCDAVSSGVSNFDLNENNLVGKLPEELYLLSDSIVSLIMSGNSLTGSLPTEFGFLRKLTSLNNFGLNFKNNQLKGPIPTEIGNLRGVGIVDFSGNNITGPIVSELGLLTATKELRLGTNNMTGPIPEELYNLNRLSELHIEDNDFTGTISTRIGLMTTLANMNFDLNKLQGPIPSEVGLMTRLESLKLDNNQLTGTIPVELSQMPQLDLLWLYENNLVGPYTCPAQDVINDCRVSCSSFFNDECRTLE